MKTLEHIICVQNFVYLLPGHPFLRKLVMSSSTRNITRQLNFGWKPCAPLFFGTLFRYHGLQIHSIYPCKERNKEDFCGVVGGGKVWEATRRRATSGTLVEGNGFFSLNTNSNKKFS